MPSVVVVVVVVVVKLLVVVVARVLVVAHVLERTEPCAGTHMLLRMTQDDDLDLLVRQRLRGLRLAQGWSLDDLAGRCFLSASTLSRIETGHRRISLDQLSAIARVLGTSIDQLVEPEAARTS